MKSLGLLILLFALTNLNCLAQSKKLFVSTDPADPRVEILLGRWYPVPQPVESGKFIFTKTPVDSVKIWVFDKDGKFTIDNIGSRFPQPEEKGSWILAGDRLYVSMVHWGERSNVYAIENISDTLVFKYSGSKNVYEPFLCGDQKTSYRHDINARFGKGEKDFNNYFIEKLSFPQQNTREMDCSVEFVVNCKGEITHVQTQGSEMEMRVKIETLLRQMPLWKPATNKGNPVDARFSYLFSWRNGELMIL